MKQRTGHVLGQRKMLCNQNTSTTITVIIKKSLNFSKPQCSLKVYELAIAIYMGQIRYFKSVLNDKLLYNYKRLL